MQETSVPRPHSFGWWVSRLALPVILAAGAALFFISRPLFYKALSIAGIALLVLSLLTAFLTFRRGNRLRSLSLLISVVIGLGSLAAYLWMLKLNIPPGAFALWSLLGAGLGVLFAATFRLFKAGPRVMRKGNIWYLLIWGGIFATNQILTLAMGRPPHLAVRMLVFTTAMTVTSSLLLILRGFLFHFSRPTWMHRTGAGHWLTVETVAPAVCGICATPIGNGESYCPVCAATVHAPAPIRVKSADWKTFVFAGILAVIILGVTWSAMALINPDSELRPRLLAAVMPDRYPMPTKPAKPAKPTSSAATPTPTTPTPDQPQRPIVVLPPEPGQPDLPTGPRPPDQPEPPVVIAPPDPIAPEPPVVIAPPDPVEIPDSPDMVDLPGLSDDGFALTATPFQQWTLSVPTGWDRTESDDGDLQYTPAEDPRSDWILQLFWAGGVGENDSSADIAELLRNAMEEQGGVTLSANRRLRMGGQSAIQFTATFAREDTGGNCAMLTTVAVFDDQVMWVNFRGPAAENDTLVNTNRRIVKSVKVTP